MARLLQRIVEAPRACSYLPDRQASLEALVLADVTPAEFGAMLERGWRRFGPVYFRPACAPCTECVSIRLPVANFRPSKTQRRVSRRASRELRVEVARPIVDADRLALITRWHQGREAERGWAPSEYDEERYGFDFSFEHPCALELTFWHDAAPGGPRLVGVSLFDRTPRALSAIYFFHDPDYARWSLGVCNVLSLVEYARSLDLEHLYLGFRVEGCPSMRYKASFAPHQLLRARPSPRETPPWRDEPAPAPTNPTEP